MKRISRYFLFLTLLHVGFSQSHAANSKTPFLERIISIRLEEETLATALKKIGKAAECTFSYNPDVLEADKIITQQFTNKTVREILDQLFKGSIQYKERKKYIILIRSKISSNNTQEVSGYVIDEATGERLKNVSVYDPISLTSAITNAYGYFQMEVPTPSNEEISLTIKKLNYADTVVAVAGRRGLLNVSMKINSQKIDALADSVGMKLKRLWLLTKRATTQAVNMENINDTLYNNFQFSLLPFVGTNHKLSGNVINDYSLNMLGGFSGGVRKLEIGGLFNTVRGDVKGVQVAGLINGVAGETKAVQLAGWVNATRRYTEGVQLAGLVNFNGDSSRTIAAAGLINFMLRDTRGVKLAGLGNIAIEEQQSPHIAGLFNFTVKDAHAAQVGSVFNFTSGCMYGAQVSGLINYASTVDGAQVGVLNVVPKKIRGAQLGVVNYATKVRGAQVGLLNVADSLKGVPIGLLSFVSRGGYHKIEIASDEIFYTNLAFRTGVKAFYNIVTAGVKPNTLRGDKTLWTFGYGVGTAPKLSKNLYLNIDLTTNQVVEGNVVEAVNLINKVYLGVEFQAARKFGITVGATLNGYVTDTDYDRYPKLFSNYTPHIMYDRTYSNDLNLKMWWGWKIGVRFL